MVTIGRAALLRLVLRVRLRQLISGVPGNWKPEFRPPAMVMVAVAAFALACLLAPTVGGICFVVIAGGAQIYLDANGIRAAPGSAAVFILLAVVSVALLLPSRTRQWRGLERLAAIQPVPAARVELVRRVDDALVAFPALLILAGPLLFEAAAQPAARSAAVRLSPGAIVPAAVAVVMLAAAASILASLLPGTPALPGTRAQPRALNRAGQVVLACYLLPLGYACFSHLYPGLPQLTRGYAPVLAALGWARYLPVAGQVTDAAISWGHASPLRAVTEWLVAAALITAISRLRPVNAPFTGEPDPALPATERVPGRWLQRVVPRGIDPRRRAVLLLCLRLAARDRQVGMFGRFAGLLVLVTGVSLWQALRTAPAQTLAAQPWEHDPVAIITGLGIACALLALADAQRRQAPARWIIRTAPVGHGRVTAVTAAFAAAAAVPPILIADALLAMFSPVPWARIVFVLAWAPLVAYLAAWGTAGTRHRPVLAWAVRAAALVAASAASFGISQLAARALADADGWLLPAAAAVAVTATVILRPAAQPHTRSRGQDKRAPADATARCR